MRLICPNCDAQYEVPDEVIPVDGRDVQCSDCGQTWYQHHRDHMPAEDDASDEGGAADDAPAPEEERAPTPEPERRKLDPAVGDILRQEAEIETRARSNDAGGIESQADLGLDDGPGDDASKRAREARDRMARMRGETPEPDDEAEAAAVAGSRRDLLPDIEEINSTLRSTSDRQTTNTELAQTEQTAKPRKRGFRGGFLTAVVVVAAMVALYIYAPRIGAAMPQLEGAMTAYAGWVDQMRVWLDSQVTGLLTWLDTTAASTDG